MKGILISKVSITTPTVQGYKRNVSLTFSMAGGIIRWLVKDEVVAKCYNTGR